MPAKEERNGYLLSLPEICALCLIEESNKGRGFNLQLAEQIIPKIHGELKTALEERLRKESDKLAVR
ncbi:MAG: hypothetical protein ACPLY7_00530 [Microgenomates group bacterium]